VRALLLQFGERGGATVVNFISIDIWRQCLPLASSPPLRVQAWPFHSPDAITVFVIAADGAMGGTGAPAVAVAVAGAGSEKMTG
jgi:hypothetical protein